MAKEHFYIIQKIVEESSDVKTYRMSFGERPFTFTPGQFILVKLLPSGPKAPLTLASSPLDQRGFEFTLKRTGDFGTKFFDQAEVGDPISVVGPSGRFCLDIESREPIAFVGRDYSISAARAYLRWARDLWKDSQKIPTRKFHLFQEVSATDQVIYEEELSEHLPGFTRTLILDGDPPAQWRDKVGRVNSSLLTLELEDLRKTEFFVCGEGIDVKQWKKIFEDLPVSDENVHIDRWS